MTVLLPLQIMMPALMVTAGKDPVLLPAFATGMENLVRQQLCYSSIMLMLYSRRVTNYYNNDLKIFSMSCSHPQPHRFMEAYLQHGIKKRFLQF